jgi:dethiobiotin synthetase
VTAVFVTATGTNIGKTFITAALIRHLRAAGRSVEALKPVVTGFDAAAATASDPGVLLAALGRPVSIEEIAGIAPWRYRAPLSPDMAARRENRPLDFAALCEFSQRAVGMRRDVLLIEGIGGVMVPLDDEHTVLDWMARLGLPVVLIAGSYLGTLSHTLTALDALRRRELPVLAVIVNETEGSAVPLADTIDSIARFARPVEVLGLPRCPDAAPDVSRLAGLLGNSGRGGS